MVVDFSLTNCFASKVGRSKIPRSSRCHAATIRSPDFESPSKGFGESHIVETTRRQKGQSLEERALLSCVRRHEQNPLGAAFDASKWTGQSMKDAYSRCEYITSEYAKTFYLGTKLMTPEKARATWAVYVWCRRTDELVDGPNASRITPEVLKRWEERLESLFEGRPVDLLDAALSHAVSTCVTTTTSRMRD